MKKYKMLIIDDKTEREEVYRNILQTSVDEGFEFEITFSDYFAIGKDYSEFDVCILDFFLEGMVDRVGEPLTAGKILGQGNPIKSGPIIIVTSEPQEFIKEDNGYLDFTSDFHRLTVTSKIKPSLYLSYYSLVNYSENPRPYRQKLQNIRNNIKESIRTFNEDSFFREEYDLLVITALGEEMQPFLDLCGSTQNTEMGAKKVEIQTNSGNTKKVLTLVCQKMGQVEMAYKLSLLQRSNKFDHIAMIGVCGGVEGKVKIGDVIIPDSSEPYDHIKINEDSESPRATSEIRKSDHSSVCQQSAREFANKFYLSRDSRKPYEQPNVHFDPMLSGSAVMNKKGELQKFGSLVGNEKSCSVDMESYAFYYFANREREVKTSLVIKSVMDLAGNVEKNDNFKEYCANLSANVLYDLIVNGYY